MKYDEYLRCAKKHLIGCQKLLQYYQLGPMSDYYVWLELYYLSGYIVEGIVVYSAYKLNNWNPNDDIQYDCNLAFSQRTNLDFYYKRQSKIVRGIETVDPFFQNRPSGALSVQGHKFQEIVKTLLKPDPSFNNVPYIGNGLIDADVELLIDKWNPDIRYRRSLSSLSRSMPLLNQDVISRLLTTCSIIYINHV